MKLRVSSYTIGLTLKRTRFSFEKVDMLIYKIGANLPDRREFKLAVRARTATVAHDAELNILERKMV